MATRSVKLKMALGSDSEKVQLRRAIWSTHRLFNEGVAYYMEKLMLMRQIPPDGGDDAESIRKAVAEARAAQTRNNDPTHPGSDEGISTALRALYGDAVPSFHGKSGNANQISRAILSPLCDPGSIGGQGTSTSGRRPKWQEMAPGPERDAAEAKWRAAREDKLSASPLALLKGLGVLPFFPPFSKTRPGWTKEGASDGPKRGYVSTFDRDMFQQAIERLMSWESWNKRVREERGKLEQQLAELHQKHLTPMPEWRVRLQKYETDRAEVLGETALAPMGRFRVNPRMTRAWDDVRRRWLEVPKGERAEPRLKRVLADEQTRLRGRMGDASDFFPWLAKPAQHSLWDEDAEEPAAVQLHVRLNEAELDFERAKETATYTLPDPLLHPLWARSGHTGDQNIHKYEITEDDGVLSASMTLLHEDPEGRVLEHEAKGIRLNPSGQWNRPQRGDDPPLRIVPFEEVPAGFHSGQSNDAKCTWLRCVDPGTGDVFFGKLGGARLQFERDDFRLGDTTDERCAARAERFARGALGRVYLNVTITLPDPPENASHKVLRRVRKGENSPKVAVNYLLPDEMKEDFFAAIADGGASMTEGFRVMSVDLGLRQFAACSVFEFTRKPSDRKLSVAIAHHPGCFMEHRRTFLVRLSGEEPDAAVLARREAVRSARFDLRAALRRLSRLLSLARLTDPSERRAEFDSLRSEDPWVESDRRARIDAWMPPALLDELLPLIDRTADPRWADAVVRVHRAWEESFGRAFARWRAEGRTRHRDPCQRGLGGLSMWHIGELQDTRKLLNAWSCHARNLRTMPDGRVLPELVRARRRDGHPTRGDGRQADIDARLLGHINNLKEDRLKVGADAIVMAALGRKFRGPDEGWVAAHPPCQLVLFEELSNYGFRADRPRRENSQLMQWAHREIPRTVAMQGEVFGLTVGVVSAEFSSRFRAGGGALSPGIRCMEVRAEHLTQLWFLDRMRKEERTTLPRPGDLVPDDGGEWFVSLDEARKPVRIHADLNAAQNLQRRFWSRHGEVFRIVCRRVTKGGADTYEPSRLGSRLSGALDVAFGIKACILHPVGDRIEDGCRLAAPAGRKPAAGKDKDDDNLFRTADEEMDEIRGKGLTFFRDPSGFVIPPLRLADGTTLPGGERWLPAREFWGIVKARIRRALESNGDEIAY